MRIAKESESRIVPFAIKGEYALFKKRLIIEFGKPLNVNDMEIEKSNELLRSEVLNLLRK